MKNTPDKSLSTLLNTPDKPLSTLLSTPSNKPLSTLLNIPSTLLMRKEDLPIFILEEVEMIKDMKRGIERKKKSQLALDNIRSHLGIRGNNVYEELEEVTRQNIERTRKTISTALKSKAEIFAELSGLTYEDVKEAMEEEVRKAIKEAEIDLEISF